MAADSCASYASHSPSWSASGNGPARRSPGHGRGRHFNASIGKVCLPGVVIRKNSIRRANPLYTFQDVVRPNTALAKASDQSRGDGARRSGKKADNLVRPNAQAGSILPPGLPTIDPERRRHTGRGHQMTKSTYQQLGIVCPICRGELTQGDCDLSCIACAETYPIVAGVPILIHDGNSVFRRNDYLATATCPPPRGLWRRAASKVLNLAPDRSFCLADFQTPDAVRQILEEIPNAKILVIGCGEDRSPEGSGADVTYTDVAIGSLNQIVCDAHNLPFADQSYDAVLAVAVLEHVIHPMEVVQEIERVLKPAGFVFAAIPFLQAVHMGAYDFTRWTYTGMRAIFAGFSDVRSGIANGTATTLVWSSEYFCTSFFSSSGARSVARCFARCATAWLIFSERYLNKTPGSYDGASSFYFFGRKSQTRLAPREIIALNRGLNPG